MLKLVLQNLDELEELSNNLTEVEDQVHQTFKMAKMDPEVRSQFDALKKAREGLKQAKATAKAIATILEHYPEDKTALRAAKDAAVMVKRFEKHESEASKIIGRLSKKGMPPALKKMGASLARMLKSRLNDPKSLRVEAWQEEASDYRSGQKGIKYILLFRIPDAAKNLNGVGLQESTLRPGVYPVSVSSGRYSTPLYGSSKPTTAKEQIAVFMEKFRGNLALKGEEDRTKDRVKNTQEIFNRIKREWNSMYGYDSGRAEMNANGTRMEFEARPLPHDSYYDRSVVEEAFEDESRKVQKRLGPIFKKYKDYIKRHDLEPSEKGWMSLYVQMK
jgi:hypothetical protein